MRTRCVRDTRNGKLSLLEEEEEEEGWTLLDLAGPQLGSPGVFSSSSWTLLDSLAGFFRHERIQFGELSFGFRLWIGQLSRSFGLFFRPRSRS